ncbi:MAG: trigger factor [Ileibacterium sp.]|nr:trigger factor [Ileibacterium sp.]
MNYTIEYPDKNTAVINIQIDKDQWEKDMEAAKAANPEADEEMAKQFCISNEAGKVLTEEINTKKLKLASAPAIISDQDADGNVMITLTCPLLPEVDLGQYTGWNIANQPETIREEELMEEIARRVNSEKLWETLPADAPAENGDRVMIDFIGEKDGVPFDGGTASNYGLVLGSSTFIPGFEEQLIGTKAGEKKDVEVSFPKDYFEPSLAGQPVVFHVTVNEVQKEIQPELNDAFIEKMKLDGVKTVEDLKAKVKAEMESFKKQEADNKVVMQALEKISEGSKIDIPQAMVDNRVEQMKQEVESNMQQYGMGLKQYLEMIGQTDEQFTESLQPQAILEIRQALILEAIAAKEDIQAEDKEIEEEYALLSSIYNFPAEQLKMMIPQGSVATQIVQRKTLDFIKDKNEAK